MSAPQITHYRDVTVILETGTRSCLRRSSSAQPVLGEEEHHAHAFFSFFSFSIPFSEHNTHYNTITAFTFFFTLKDRAVLFLL